MCVCVCLCVRCVCFVGAADSSRHFFTASLLNPCCPVDSSQYFSTVSLLPTVLDIFADSSRHFLRPHYSTPAILSTLLNIFLPPATRLFSTFFYGLIVLIGRESFGGADSSEFSVGPARVLVMCSPPLPFSNLPSKCVPYFIHLHF